MVVVRRGAYSILAEIIVDEVDCDVARGAELAGCGLEYGVRVVYRLSDGQRDCTVGCSLYL
jgi:hypothetical protein